MNIRLTARARLRLTLAATVAAAAATLAGCSSGNPGGMPGMTGMPQQSGSSASVTASTSPVLGTPAAGPHNNADVMFTQMMIPHHQQAIEMSDIVLGKTDLNPDVTQLAEKIKAAQAPEIAQMSGWLAGWGQNPSPTMGMGHDMGGGMMSQADMDALMKATGTEAAKLFLTGMVQHHQGAITMAEQQVANGQNAETVALATKIIADQKAEIATMKQLLQNL